MKKNAKRMLSVLMAVLLLVVTTVSGVGMQVSAATDQTDLSGSTTTKEITILHTNDMHASVANLGYVKSMKDSIPGSILVDGGDATQGSSLATYTQGLGIIQLMNAAGYDGMVAGNHEFDYGTSQAITNASAATFPVVSANAVKADGTLVFANTAGNNGCNFIKTVDGVKVGFFGITSTETAYKTNPSKLEGVTFQAEIDTAKVQVQALKDQGADIIVGLFHVGIDSTSDPTSHKIAQEVEGIDIIVDGHSHSQETTKINNTYIAQTGTKLANIGKITIQVDDQNKVSACTTELIAESTYKVHIKKAIPMTQRFLRYTNKRWTN